jgi:sortase A
VASALSLNRVLLGLAALSLALGLWQLGGAAAIHGKAWLAQRLLDRAWAATLAGAEEAKPWPWADTWPVARLKVPAQDIDLYVLAGASGRTLAFGPAVVEGTEGLSHQILSGHRDTHFAFLRDLAEGSQIELQDRRGAWHAYRVRGHQVIDVRQPVTAQPAGPAALLTLVTCWPFDAVTPGGPLRYAVTAEAVAPDVMPSEAMSSEATLSDAILSDAIHSDRPLGGAVIPATTMGGHNRGEGIPDGTL